MSVYGKKLNFCVLFIFIVKHKYNICLEDTLDVCKIYSNKNKAFYIKNNETESKSSNNSLSGFCYARKKKLKKVKF